MTLVSTTVRYKLFGSEFINICDKLLRKGTITAQEHTLSILQHLAQLGRQQRSSLAASSALDAFVYALKSGTPLARERAAALVVEFSQDETARRRFEELNVLSLLQRVTEIGTPNAKKHAVNAIRKLQHPIEPTSTSPATSSVLPLHTHHEPLSFQPAEDWLKSSTNDHKQGPPKKKNIFVNNYRLRAPARASHI
eukprot:Phypoly_transcript_13002.p1 GENE.Phypoly_transcript_13002~~Phypoly_transcript_13002.p1  ORF type:complete len:195 (+),score=30.77 Phypoly_transcript_13002:476-1060(+)